MCVVTKAFGPGKKEAEIIRHRKWIPSELPYRIPEDAVFFSIFLVNGLLLHIETERERERESEKERDKEKRED